MTEMLLQSSHFKATLKQPLRNVLIYAPMIIWIDQGTKRLWWHEETITYTPDDWLVTPASQYLTFVNEPALSHFHSRALTFYQPPPQAWLSDSASRQVDQSPRIRVTPKLAYCFNTLFDMSKQGLSTESQKQFLYGFYNELKELGLLHRLFPQPNHSVKERLARYLSVNPGEAHTIEVAAQHLAMSRATLSRRLTAEKTSFRQVLSNVRMVYALSLMQQSRSQLSIALSCGYRSEARFSQRFKKTFGLTPKEYLQTI